MTTRALIDSEIQGLSRALATYDQAIRDFGPVRPFINIREAEARHAAALINLFERAGYLASDGAKFVIGAELVIDGGYTAH